MRKRRRIITILLIIAVFFASAPLFDNGVYAGNDASATVLQKANVSSKATVVYTGKAVFPAVTVTVNGKTLTRGKSYKLSGSRTSIGPGTVTVKGIGKYSGTVKKSYSVVPGRVTVKSVTGTANQMTVKWGKKSGGVRYQIKYRVKGTSAWNNTTSGTATTKTIKKLKKDYTYEVKVRAYKPVNGKNYYGAFSAVKTVKNGSVVSDARIPVFTFHRLVPQTIKDSRYKDNQWIGSIEGFESMMEYLHVNGYRTVSTEELEKWIKDEIDLPKKSVMITFDDGYYEDYYLVYPILKEYDMKAVSFVVGSWITETTPEYDGNTTAHLGSDKIEAIRAEYPSFEIQSHSFDLHYNTADSKHAIVSKNRDELIQDTLSNEPYGFTVMAYPYGAYNDTIKEVLKENGYTMAFAFSPSGYATKGCDLYAVPRIRIVGTDRLKDFKAWLPGD